MTLVPPDELLRAVRLFIWGFELYTNRMRLHFGHRLLWHMTLPRRSRTGSLEHLGIRGYSFHGFGVWIEDEHGLIFDADFWPTAPDEKATSLAWVDPWKLRYFIESCPVGLADFRGTRGQARLEEDFGAIPAPWIEEQMAEARNAFREATASLPLLAEESHR